MESIDWQTHEAAVWRGRSKSFRIVRERDAIRLDDLLGIDTQKAKLIQNTERFLSGAPANHVLLWGSRGTGKSSMVKALLNEYASRSLRVLEVEKSDLVDLPDLVDDLRDRPQKFIVYCDDMAFNEDERDYRHLKSIMEGSLELPPKNVRLYATSNRRHLLPEFQHENDSSRLVGRELHHGEAIEEKISLSDRFGLCISFYPIDETQYFAMVDHLFPGHTDRERLHVLARRFSMEKGVRSGRTARQFFQQYSGEL
jgi:predicted AAA+ superfamily ATPase